jgi:hypothetical protein
MFCNKFPPLATQYPINTQFPSNSRQKPEITHNNISRQKPQITHNNISLPSPPPYSFYQNNTVYFIWCTAAVRRCRFVWMLHKCFTQLLFGAFVTLRKATVSFVCLSVVRLYWKNKSPPIGRIFITLDVGKFVENLTRKFKFHENRIKIMVLSWRPIYVQFWKCVFGFFLSREMCQTKAVEKSKHTFQVQIFIRKPCRLRN